MVRYPLPTYYGHIGRLQALLALLDVEFDPLSLFQVPEAVTLDSGEMDKDILALLLRYEPIALASVEPLDRTHFFFRHVTPFENFVRRKVGLILA